MKKQILVIFSVILIIMPWLGIPGFFRNILITLFATLILVILYLFDERDDGFMKSIKTKTKQKPDSYTESSKDDIGTDSKMV